MKLHGIEIPREQIEAFCRAKGIRRQALFGSILRDDFRPDSDVDVLVEFQPGVRVGLAFIRIQDKLSAILTWTKLLLNGLHGVWPVGVRGGRQS